jgi:hypothetical protein
MADNKGIEANALEAAARMMPFLLQSSLLYLSNSADDAVLEFERGAAVAIIRQRVTSSTLARERQQLRNVETAGTSPTMGSCYEIDKPSLWMTTRSWKKERATGGYN